MFNNKKQISLFTVLCFGCMFFITPVFALQKKPLPEPEKKVQGTQQLTVSSFDKQKAGDTSIFLKKMDHFNQQIQILEQQLKIAELQKKIKIAHKIKKAKKPVISFSSIHSFDPSFNSNSINKKKKSQVVNIRKKVQLLPVMVSAEGTPDNMTANLLYPEGNIRIVKTGDHITLIKQKFVIEHIGRRGVSLKNLNGKSGLMLGLGYNLGHQKIFGSTKNNNVSSRYGKAFLKPQNASDSTFNKPQN